MSRRLFCVAAAVFALSSASGASTSVAAQTASAARDQLVVSPAWLAAHLKDANLIVIHVGMGDEGAYKTGHIPGAQFVPLEEFAAPMDHAKMKAGDLMLELPEDAALRAMLQEHGITEQSKVVLYFGKNGISEVTRAILTLDHAGFGANTAMLQGGFGAWTRAGHATTAELPKVAPSTLASLKTKPVTVDASFVQTIGGKRGMVLADGRDQVAYDSVGGSNGRPGGHLPGAVSLSYRVLYNELNELRPAAELEAAFAKAGIRPGETVVGYCWIGQYATAMLFAARTLGHDVMLYDGSFEDWTFRKLPLETTKKGGGSR